MISDKGLYSLSVFLGSLAMLLIILYHFLQVNSRDSKEDASAASDENDQKEAKKEVIGKKDGKLVGRKGGQQQDDYRLAQGKR